MFQIKVLGSGSSGNCIYVETDDCTLLLDVGLPLSDIKTKLREFDVKLSSIDYIFITHNHGDHLQGLEGIMKTYDIKVISSFETLFGVDMPEANMLYLEGGQEIDLGNLKVTGHDVSHDAPAPLAFTLQNTLGEKLLYMTDLGVVPEGDFTNYEVYITEANYSYDILSHNYKYGDLHLSQCMRVHSDEGHLSVEDCLDFLSENVGISTEAVVLSHLSGRNGNKELFLEKANEAIPFMQFYIAEHGLDIKLGELLPF